MFPEGWKRVNTDQRAQTGDALRRSNLAHLSTASVFDLPQVDRHESIIGMTTFRKSN